MSDDYTQAGWIFKIRKVVRYVRMYGFSRTLVKIRGQYHMNAVATFEGQRWLNPGCRNPGVIERNVAMIGCGNFAFCNLAYYLSKESPNFLRVAYDTDRRRSLSLCRRYGGEYVVADWHDILKDSSVKIVFIASNHSTHAEYAIECIKSGKHVHIEKPHVVSEDQLRALLKTMRRFPDCKVFLGFNRPKSYLFKILKKEFSKETGPTMINWFVVGHAIPNNHWYYERQEGGRILGNVSHWTDLTLQLISVEKAFPCVITSATPNGSVSDFVVSIVFADRSCAAITFAAKGEVFEGVTEILNLQRGNLLASLTDFKKLKLTRGMHTVSHEPLLRDHGHGSNIAHSFTGVNSPNILGEEFEYVSATAKLFLAVMDSIETGESVYLSREEALNLDLNSRDNEKFSR